MEGETGTTGANRGCSSSSGEGGAEGLSEVRGGLRQGRKGSERMY